MFDRLRILVVVGAEKNSVLSLFIPISVFPFLRCYILFIEVRWLSIVPFKSPGMLFRSLIEIVSESLGSSISILVSSFVNFSTLMMSCPTKP